MVFGYHWSQYANAEHENFLTPLQDRLDLSVPTFFVVSGFVMYRPFLAARLTTHVPKPSVARYGLKRVMRIFPAYWVALAVIAVWPGLHGDSSGPVLLTLTQSYRPGHELDGLPQAWSLSTEVGFYAALPLIAWVASRLARITSAQYAVTREWIVIGVFAAVGPAFRMATFPYPETGGEGSWLPALSTWFAGGMALALLSVTGADTAPARPWWYRAPLWWGLAAVVWVSYAFIPVADTPEEDVLMMLAYTFFGVALVLPAVLGSAGEDRVRRLLRARTLRGLGVVSYGLFLWHPAVLAAVFNWGAFQLQTTPGKAVWFAFPLALGASLMLAVASYTAIERPFVRLGRQLIRGVVPSRERATSTNP
jgi:peptidoglycan/LPS O-acetylase OafA/YrhL